MGSKKKSTHLSSSPSSSASASVSGSNNSNKSSASSSSRVSDSSIEGLREKHQRELENLTLINKPCTTLKFFAFAIYDHVKQLGSYLVSKGGWAFVLFTLFMTSGVLVAYVEGSHEKRAEELLRYLQFVLWWVALGVASSIGLGSGLHTFVLYLGPHIALFTIKAMQCGRVDLKTAPYDTIQLKRGPSWLDKDCVAFGPPLFKSVHGERVPLSSILPQVQLEAMLWGLGTALGELPPYFISRAARLSGSEVVSVQELDDSSDEDSGVIGRSLKKVKHWLISHSQYLNFPMILLLASVPNPLFDLAGILCGQFGVPFWEFFLATLFGKAIIKTHIQTVFIISVCNNQLLDWVENELIWILSFVPGFASILPDLIAKLHAVKEKYLASSPPVTSNVQVKKWGISFATIWNTVVWLVLLNFFFKIVNSTAQSFLKKKQEKELTLLKKKSPASKH